MSSRILIGTHNRGKVIEIAELLRDLDIELLSLNDFPAIGVAEENEPTYAGNAQSKAIFYAGRSGLWTIADDSGLEVEYLDGAPGVYSARYAGGGASDEDRRRRLLAEMGVVEDRKARFVCAAALSSPDRKVRLAHGICCGRILTEPRGTGGFGYDPLFVPNGFQQTFAELDEGIKNKISHRARAFRKARAFLAALSVTNE
jgi:XTP/dITP diphosphohydrolase